MRPQLGCSGGGGLGRARKHGHTLHIINASLNYVRNTISIKNAEHVVHKTGTHWDEGHIGKSTPVLHHHLRDVEALKTATQPSFWNSKARCLVVSESFFKGSKKGRIK